MQKGIILKKQCETKTANKAERDILLSIISNPLDGDMSSFKGKRFIEKVILFGVILGVFFLSTWAANNSNELVFDIENFILDFATVCSIVIFFLAANWRKIFTG